MEDNFSTEKTKLELKERLKELNFLYSISKITEKYHSDADIDNLLTEIVSEIPTAYQYPQDTCAVIEYAEQKYKTDDFKKTGWGQKSEIIIDNQVKGTIAVYYKSSHPEKFKDSPFLKEEYDLLNLLAKRISNKIKIIEQQKKLREQMNFLSITLNSIGDGVIVTDEAGYIERLNQEAQKLTKWNIAEAKGKHITEVFNIVNAKTGKTVANPVDKVIETGEIVGLANHTKLIAEDGTEHYIADRASPIKDDNDNIYGVVLVFGNITTEYNLQEEIKNKAGIFSKAVEEAPFPIMLHNDKNEVIDINEEWEEITGYSKQEIPTLAVWTKKAYGKNKNSVREYIHNVHKIKGKVNDGEFTIRTKHNELRIWDFKTSHIGLDEDGNNLYISMAVDITERNLMEQEIKALNRLYKSLSSVNQLIAKVDSIDELINKLTEKAVDLGNYNTAWIAKVNENQDELDILSVSGREPEFLKGKEKVKLNFAKDNLNVYEKTLYYNKETIINEDNKSELEENQCESKGIFPIEVFDKIWGLAVFCSSQINRFNEREIKLLKELSTDISLGMEKIITNKKLSASEKEYRQLFEKAPVGIFKTTSSGKVKLVNPFMAKILGFDSTVEVYNNYNNLNKDLYVDFNRRKLFINMLEQKGVVRNFIYQAYDKNNKIKWIEMNARINSDKHGDDFLIEGFATDITERKKHEEKIAYMSFHDKLTGLYNRAYIEDAMKRIDTPRNLPVSLIMADLNNLKLINDSHGHSVGDDWIKKAAEIISKSCRQEDILARWGGDEFVIILPNTTHKESEKIVERIHAAEINNNSEIDISMALGTATKSSADENLFETLSIAEDRMYINKFTNKKSDRSMVLSSFLNILKEKSYETESHVNRISEMAREFGERLNLDKEDRDKLFLLSLLHDIGKISIPENILNKTDKITDKEWELIKTHPESGHRIIKSIPRFSHIAEEILHHHERWDGTGYPDELKGEEIPLLSRILTIVDSFDVMRSGRPYKRAMSEEEIFKELERCSGSQFDPELIDVFLDILHDE